MTATVARRIVDQLVALGADLAFGVPGESYLAVLDALHDTPALRFITCRQESGAAFAAEAHGKLMGRPGLVMVTRGPGVMNAAIGVHTAQQDETPLIVLVGQVPRSQRGRDAFQEVDLRQIFGSVCKWVHELDQPDQAAEVIHRAWTVACSGRPGPVMIGLPEDVLELPSAGPVVAASAAAQTAVATAVANDVRAQLAAAQRPVVIVGGSRWSEAAIEMLPSVLAGIPLITGFRRQDLVDHRLPNFAGSLGLGADPSLINRLRQADLVLAVGDRLDDPSTNGFTIWPLPDPGVPLVHVHPDPHELGRVHRATTAIVADPEAFLTAIGSVTLRSEVNAWTQAARAGYEQWQGTAGQLDEIVRGLRALLADDAIVTNGAGNFTRPVQRAYTYHRPGRQLAPVGGAMGYGLPAAMAAALTYPTRHVACVAGDGDVMMTVQELATISHEHLAVVVLVVDNRCYGTIRTHQERRYPDRPFGTALTNPDFVQLAESFGMTAWRTTGVGDTLAALGEALGSRAACLVHLVV
ncbi:MAG TPA: thiamine pyrophosphate-binding protein [Ilumatobacteraceae bacterium]|nr:thiamine pyrophosphate-binding protein [Ilumatobacteraceae bacterium]